MSAKTKCKLRDKLVRGCGDETHCSIVTYGNVDERYVSN